MKNKNKLLLGIVALIFLAIGVVGYTSVQNTIAR